MKGKFAILRRHDFSEKVPGFLSMRMTDFDYPAPVKRFDIVVCMCVCSACMAVLFTRIFHGLPTAWGKQQGSKQCKVKRSHDVFLSYAGVFHLPVS